MKLSLQTTIAAAVVFALIALSVAIKGFWSLGELTDAQHIADAKGFASFWAFLGTIAIAVAAVAWRMARLDKGDDDAQ